MAAVSWSFPERLTGNSRVGRIAVHEIRSVARDGTLRLASILLLVLLLAALLEGIRESSELGEERAAAQEVMRHQWLEQGEKNPHSAAHLGIYAFRPASTLTFADPGLNPHVGEAIWLEAHYQNQPVYRPTRGREPLGRFGDLTFSRILQHFLPLLIILLAFQVFARERETGILAQLLATGTSRRELVIGKLSGVLGALTLLLLPVVGLATVLLLSRGAEMEEMVRLGLLGLAYAAYLAVWVLISTVLSVRASSGRMALVALLSLWIVQGFILPPAAAEVSRALHPLPSAQAFDAQVTRDVAEGVDGHNPLAERTLQLRDSILSEYGVDQVEDLPLNFEGVALQAGEDFSNQVFDLRFSELWGRIEAQNRVQLRAASLSPYLAVRSLSMALSGTDWFHVRDFQVSAEEYRRSLVETMNLALIHEFESQSYGDNLHGRETWERVPEFEYTSPTLAAVLRSQGEAAAWLAAWLLFGLLLSLGVSLRSSDS